MEFVEQVEQAGEIFDFVPSQADWTEFYAASSQAHTCRECGVPTSEHSPICDQCSFEQWVVEMENFAIVKGF